MSRGTSIGIVLGIGLGLGPLAAGDPPAKPTRATAPGGHRHVGPDFKIVFWFGRTGLRHQVYDVRKGQYTPAVDDWVRRRELAFDPSGFVRPSGLATVREVTLKPDAGQSEVEQLEAAIRREEAAILGASPARLPRLSAPRPVRAPAGRAKGGRPRIDLARPEGVLPGRPSRLGAAPPSAPFPVPIPYPRPHP